MKKINIFLALGVLLIIGATSCRKDPKVGGTATQSLAGEWWVKLDGGKGEFGNSYYSIWTYNTASNRPDSMWIDDNNTIWQVKGKVACNAGNATFGSTNAINNVYYDSQFTVTNGKILANAAHAPGSGDKTDSITFQMSFSDEDPVVVHTVTGYKRTGFSQDDH